MLFVCYCSFIIYFIQVISSNYLYTYIYVVIVMFCLIFAFVLFVKFSISYEINLCIYSTINMKLTILIIIIYKYLKKIIIFFYINPCLDFNILCHLQYGHLVNTREYAVSPSRPCAAHCMHVVSISFCPPQHAPSIDPYPLAVKKN